MEHLHETNRVLYYIIVNLHRSCLIFLTVLDFIDLFYGMLFVSPSGSD